MLLPVLSILTAAPARKSLSRNQKRPLAASLVCGDRREMQRKEQEGFNSVFKRLRRNGHQM
jgi:hypothetical protein